MRYYKMLMGWYYIQNTFLELNNNGMGVEGLPHALA